jgi:hypothetical protein
MDGREVTREPALQISAGTTSVSTQAAVVTDGFLRVAIIEDLRQ